MDADGIPLSMISALAERALFDLVYGLCPRITLPLSVDKS
jgi:hypothetical protein